MRRTMLGADYINLACVTVTWIALFVLLSPSRSLVRIERAHSYRARSASTEVARPRTPLFS
jgi:hypothetical protein